MAQGNFVILEDRGVLAVAGADRRVFLQGLVSNDVKKVRPDRALYAALLTAQLANGMALAYAAATVAALADHDQWTVPNGLDPHRQLEASEYVARVPAGVHADACAARRRS